MRSNHIKAKLRRGETSLGGWLSLGSVAAARLMAQLGFDWLTVDVEHTAQHPSLMADMVATIVDSGKCAPFVRLPNNSVEWFKWAFDAGAWGVIVPMVNNREEAERAVSWSKYPPAGIRSLGGAFAPLGLGTMNRSEYLSAANDELMVICQIESAQGLANVEEIVSVPGVDVAFVGPNDLHAQLGLVPSTEGNEPEFVAALEKIKSAAKAHNVALGMFSSDGPAAARRVSEGFHMISVTTDASCLISGSLQNLKLAQG